MSQKFIYTIPKNEIINEKNLFNAKRMIDQQGGNLQVYFKRRFYIISKKLSNEYW